MLTPYFCQGSSREQVVFPSLSQNSGASLITQKLACVGKGRRWEQVYLLVLFILHATDHRTNFHEFW